jgi:SAM-dependent methyltransferase
MQPILFIRGGETFHTFSQPDVEIPSPASFIWHLSLRKRIRLIISPMTAELIVVPDSVLELAENSVGAYFEGVAKQNRAATARDHTDPGRAIKKGQLLETFTSLQGKKLLEIGSGFGTNLATWIKRYHLDGFGTERDTEGFSSSFKASRVLFAANGLDPERIIRVNGDTLPFEDASFDIVYAGNVLEHTEDPIKVLTEAVRVLRPGGIFHAEIPNFLSYFEGHYFVPQPPLFWRWVLPAWVRLLGRDPAYAYTLRTEINPMWCRRAVKQVNKLYPAKLISDGAEIFMNRLKQPFTFDMERTASQLGILIRLIQYLNFGNWVGRLIVLFQGHYPLYLTVRRESV